ncbi:MAG: class I SAM-dependent methyltransferase [Gammaproteobacteria bacterium]|nr:class I SAM-dependent methyltransferase [Gammaproteobacteria bacterium]
MSIGNADSWDRYWAHGFLTSCADAFAGNYEGSMRTVWEKRFSALPDGSRVLDICTGNGAIALIAAATARRLDCKLLIHAIDLADIHPERAVHDEARPLLDDINFHSRTDVCETGFTNDSFDLISGHFALEYADREPAVRELVRITAENGEHMFVMHSTESVILKTAAVELEHIDLLHGSALFERAGDFLRLVANKSAEEKEALAKMPEAEERRTALNRAAALVSAAIKQSAHPEILRTALGHVSAAYKALANEGLDKALQQLQQGAAEIAANAGRLADLRQAASTLQDIKHLGELYAKYGFVDFSFDVLKEEPAGLIGWIVHARRTG